MKAFLDARQRLTVNSSVLFRTVSWSFSFSLPVSSFSLSVSLSLFLSASLSAFPSLIPEGKRDVSLAEGLWSSALGVGKQELRWWTQPPRFNTSCKFQEKGTPRAFPPFGGSPRSSHALIRASFVASYSSTTVITRYIAFRTNHYPPATGNAPIEASAGKKFRNSRRNASLVWTLRYCEEI